MLRLKTGICIDCPPGSPPRILTAGRCSTHYWAYRRTVGNAKKVRDPNHINEQKALGLWFEYHNENTLWICENCLGPLDPYSPQVRSSCQAHILPKEHFHSVKTVLENHLTLGGMGQKCTCHADYDRGWEKAQAMPVFSIATERFQTFKHLIDPKEYKRLPAVWRSLI